MKLTEREEFWRKKFGELNDKIFKNEDEKLKI